MKNHYLLAIVSLLHFSTLNAQVEVFLTIPNATPVGLALNGNDLFIGDINNAKIHKVDLSQTTPTLTDFITSGISFPALIEMSGNTLYIPQISNLSSSDVTLSSPILTTIAPTNFSFGFVKNGNDLYTSYRNDGKVVKFDLSQTNPTATDVVTGLGSFLSGIALNGNDLYIARSGENKISKIDITQTNPIVTDVLSNVSAIDLLLIGNNLYFSGNNAVSKIDITQTNPIKETIVDNLPNTVWGIVIFNNYLYMAQQTGGQILRFNLNLLGVDNLENENQFKIYPNPTSSKINITNSNELLNYKITDVSGKILLEGNTKNEIDISYLESGLYLVKFENNQTIKILKN